MGASLHGLLTTPARYGVRWDVFVKTLDPAGMGDAGEQVVALPGVGAASVLGEGLVIDGEATSTIALEPLKGTSITPVVSEEQALFGTGTRSRSVPSRNRTSASTSVTRSPCPPTCPNTEKRRLLIVGTAVMNAIDEGSPGLGAVVTPALMHDLVPIEAGDAIVVDLTENTDGEAARVAIERDLTVGDEFDPPRRQNAVRNVERIQSLPYLLAAVGISSVASLGPTRSS